MGICGISTMTPYGIYGGVLIILLGLYAWSKAFEFEDNSIIDPKKDPKKYIQKKLKNNHGIALSTRIDFGKDPDGNIIDVSKYATFKVDGDRLEPSNIHNGDICLITTLECIKKKSKHPIYLFDDGHLAQVVWEGNYEARNLKSLYNKLRYYRKYYKLGISFNEFEKLLKERHTTNIVLAFKYNKVNNTYIKELIIYSEKSIVGEVEYIFSMKIC